MRLVGVRGATTIDADAEEEILERTEELLRELMAANDLRPDDLVSIIFTATDDVTAGFPAAAAREIGLSDVPLLCARELAVDGGVPRCIRVLVHCYSDMPRASMRHVYLREAVSLREDLRGGGAA